MSDKSVQIKEITELLSNPYTFRTDLEEAFGSVKERLHNKYVGRILKTMEEFHDIARENPSPEVRLLKAYKPFVPQESHERIDGFIDMLNGFYALKDIRNGVGRAWTASAGDNVDATPKTEVNANVSTAETNPSVHPDGVYDIDEQCYLNSYGTQTPVGFDSIAGLLMFFTFMNR